MITIMFFNYLTYYLLIGALQLLVMDYAVSKAADIIGDDDRKFNNMERTIILLLWPIYAWVFWFEFIRSLSNKK